MHHPCEEYLKRFFNIYITSFFILSLFFSFSTTITSYRPLQILRSIFADLYIPSPLALPIISFSYFSSGARKFMYFSVSPLFCYFLLQHPLFGSFGYTIFSVFLTVVWVRLVYSVLQPFLIRCFRPFTILWKLCLVPI